MSGPTIISGPAFSPERFADRLAEVIRVADDPEAFARLPAWTQRVMLTLKDQLVPPEFASVFLEGRSLVGEGVCVAWMAYARDAMTEVGEGDYARRVAERLTRAPEASHVPEQILNGEMVQAPEFREHVMRRLFAGSAAERRAFAEGLALGNRVYDLFAAHAGQNSTDATRIYLLLWLYWPEVARAESIGEAARLIEGLLVSTRNVVGQNWDERFRKIANRIGLSYREKQAQTKVRGKKRPAARTRASRHG